MVHSGYEATAVTESVTKPWKLLKLGTQGIRTEGPMAPDISLEHQRPAEFTFSRHVQDAMAKIKHEKPNAKDMADAD
jgi:hypothetical protein